MEPRIPRCSTSRNDEFKKRMLQRVNLAYGQDHDEFAPAMADSIDHTLDAMFGNDGKLPQHFDFTKLISTKRNNASVISKGDLEAIATA